MSTPTRIARIVERHGFVRHDARGFAGWHRIHPDGRKQLLHVFFWRNAKHAEKAGLPHAYIVVVPTINAPSLPGEQGYALMEDTRFRIATAGLHGEVIKWADAAAEFEKLVLPIFDASEAEARALLAGAESTYAL